MINHLFCIWNSDTISYYRSLNLYCNKFACLLFSYIFCYNYTIFYFREDSDSIFSSTIFDALAASSLFSVVIFCIFPSTSFFYSDKRSISLLNLLTSPCTSSSLFSFSSNRCVNLSIFISKTTGFLLQFSLFNLSLGVLFLIISLIIPSWWIF